MEPFWWRSLPGEFVQGVKGPVNIPAGIELKPVGKFKGKTFVCFAGVAIEVTGEAFWDVSKFHNGGAW